MSESTYNSLMAIGIDVEKGKEKFNGNIDLYLIFLKKLLESDDIHELDFHISRENITQAVFAASALTTESQQLYADSISDCLIDIEEALKNNDIESARKSTLVLSDKVNSIKNIIK